MTESTDPAVAEWHKTLSEAVRVHEQSTSAQLRKVEAELHEALRRAADLEQVREELKHTKATLEAYVIDEQDWRNDPDGIEARAERDQLRTGQLKASREHLDEACAEAAEMRVQRLAAAEQVEVLRHDHAAALRDLSRAEQERDRAIGQAEKLRGYWAESFRNRAEIQDRLTRVEADAAARQVELTAAYHELGDVVAERDQLRRDLAGAVIARHEAERELADMRPDSTPTKES